MKPWEFWKLTPVELYEMVVGYSERKELNRKEMIYQAWHMAAFFRADNLPPLAEVLKKHEEKEPTEDDTLAMLKMIAIGAGGTIKEV